MVAAYREAGRFVHNCEKIIFVEYRDRKRKCFRRRQARFNQNNVHTGFHPNSRGCRFSIYLYNAPLNSFLASFPAGQGFKNLMQVVTQPDRGNTRWYDMLFKHFH